MDILDKYNADFLGPRNILGVSVSPNYIVYRFSDLKHVQYLDLADSKFLFHSISSDQEFTMDKQFYHRFVKLRLDRLQKFLNENLFIFYSITVEKYIKDLQFSVIFKYLRVFNTLRIYEFDMLSRKIAVLLIRLLFLNDIESPLLVKAILKSVFLNFTLVTCLIGSPPLSGPFTAVVSRDVYNRSFIAGLLSNVFQNHRICPILGSSFAPNKHFLDELLNLRIKKKEFNCILMPFHDGLMNFRIYAGFKPSREGIGGVRLDETKFTTRDHLLFELVAVIWLRIGRVRYDMSDIEIIRDSIRLIYKTVPYPYISASEMVSRLLDINPFLSEADINATVNEYEYLFPEWDKTGPRSLKDLCRCTIRESFNERYKVNDAIRELKIPRRIFSFLSLQEYYTDISSSYSPPKMLPTLFYDPEDIV